MTNLACPDWFSHYENLAERLFPGVEVLTQEQDETVVNLANMEYLECEGHQ